jgi:hypothetical protein
LNLSYFSSTAMQPINSNSANASIAGQARAGLDLDTFAQKASQSDQLQAMVVDGQAYTVQAVGQLSTAGGQRSVAWVQGDVDTTTLFMQALGASFGGPLSAAVSKELGLAPNPGKPLASRLVTQAMDMAQTGQQALSGIDFSTRLAHSASNGGAAFKAVAAELAISPAALTDASRRDIDARMVQRFDAASASGQTPVSAAQADQWLRAELAAGVGGPVASDSATGAGYLPQQRV